jgi:CheY-like chemotaxis protein
MDPLTPQPSKTILALVDDLFFTLKIGDTAKHLGISAHFAADGSELSRRLDRLRPALMIVDLTLSCVYMTDVFEGLASDPPQAAVPILGYTTHADWKRTGPLHDKCTRVVTKDTLSRSLAELIRELIPPA